MRLQFSRLGTGRITLLFLVALGTACAPGHRLRLDLDPGHLQRRSLTQSMQAEMNLGLLGQQSMENLASFELNDRVIDRRPDGSLTQETTIERVKFEAKTPGGRLEFDSASATADERNNPLAVLSEMVGRSINMTLSERGDVVELTGLAALIDEMFDLPEDDSDNGRYPSMMRQAINDKMIQAVYDQTLTHFPDQKVRAGDSWTHESQSENPILGVMTSRTNYRLVGPERKLDKDCIKIQIDSGATFSGEGMLVDQLRETLASFSGGKNIELEIGEMSGVGSAWIDQRTGETVESDVEQAVKVTVRVPLPLGSRKLELTIDLKQQLRLRQLN